MIKRQENLAHEEKLRALGLFSLEKAQEESLLMEINT